MLKRQVYSGWAFDEDASQKRRINDSIYNELKDRTKFFCKGDRCTTDDLHKFCCIQCLGGGYASSKFRILSNPYSFTNNELALVSDSGNLCFGYRMDGSDIIVIYID